MFPFALAGQAVADLEDLATGLRGVVTAHDNALSIAHEDFEGETRRQFDAAFAASMDELRSCAIALDNDAAHLRDTIAFAHWLEDQP